MKYTFTSSHGLGWIGDLLITLCSVMLLATFQASPVFAEKSPPVRRIHAPYFPGAEVVRSEQTALVWFGEVNNTSNHAIGRIGYNDDYLSLTFHIFDRHLFYNPRPGDGDLIAWDAVTVYLDLNGNSGDFLMPHTYRFVAQLNHFQARDAYQAVYQGNGSGWVESSAPFVTTTGWRGNQLNGNQTKADNRGWRVTFRIRFSDLGVAALPEMGTNWGVAFTVHDRDDMDGTPIPIQVWPEAMDAQRPGSWGQLIFGRPVAYNPPPTAPGGEVTVRHNLNGATVKDGSVGGYTTCGKAFSPNFFQGWGEANYAGDGKMNIQNQWDVADWPCFSRYYVTFPLDAIPAGKTVISATLTLHQFGNAYPAKAPTSFIQVYTVAEDWEEATLTWNNSPLALDYVDSAWVKPILEWVDWPGVPIEWDVSRAVVEMYQQSEPLRLVLFSADGDYHSGKYFSTSDTGDWNAAARPTLHIVWGEPAASSPHQKSTFIPFILK